MPLDMLVTGRIATLVGDHGFGWVEAVGIRDGRVAFAGSAVELETRADPHTERIELEPGEIALPGIIDAHLHVAGAAVAADQLDVLGAESLDAALRLVADAAARLPAPAWITGSGWDRQRWGAWPSADALEAAAPGRLIALRSADHHSLVASHAALVAAGIDASTPDPDGGAIRRSASGEPDGVLFENATRLVFDLVPPPDAETLRRAIAAYGRELLSLGVVSAHDPGSLAPDPANRALAVYASLDDARELPVKIRACVRADGLDDAIGRGLRSGGPLGAPEGASEPGGARAARRQGRATMGWLKLFADGTLGSQTAALLEPIEGTTERGMFTTPPEILAALATAAAEAGIATMIHAIGDAAVREALTALAPTAGRTPFMPRVEHVQLCHPDDRARFAELRVVASVQPVHLRADAGKARRDWGARAEESGYAWRSLVDAGAIVAFGTDAPVEPADPWPGIALAVLRHDPSWPEDVATFGPAEALSLEQALRAASVAPAMSAGDPLGGRLVPGSPADLIVLPAEPGNGEAATGSAKHMATFAQVRPRLVLLDGEVVFER